MNWKHLAVAAFLIAMSAIPGASQTLTVSVTGAGKVTGAGIDCGSDCSETFAISLRSPARPVVLTATPNNGSSFQSWGGPCAAASGVTCTVTVPLRGAATVSASFVPASSGAVPDPRAPTGDTRSVSSPIAAAPPSVVLDPRALASAEGARDPVSIETVAIPVDSRDPKGSGPDLTVSRIDVDAGGRIRYIAANATSAGSVNPFVADVLVDEERKDTIKHPELAGVTAHTVTTATRFPDCGTHAIRVLLDTQATVNETSENNNGRSESVTPPCPDLAIEGIRKNWTDGNTRFRAQVTIQNLGDLPSPAGIILMVNTSGPVGIPGNEYITLEALQPGQSQSFTVGPKFLGTSTVSVTSFVDFYKLLVEKIESNNETTKSL